MISYQEMLKHVLYNGDVKSNRTGVDTLSVHGYMFEHYLSKGFPLLTTKQMGIKSIAAELEFFIKGLTDKKWLQDRNCHIWDEWANPEKVDIKLKDWLDIVIDKNILKKEIQLEEMDLGPIYGYQWRNWKTSKSIIKNDMITDNFQKIDQLRNAITTLRRDPMNRQLVISAWNPSDISKMALPPCHFAFQLLSDGTNLDLLWNQRSCDLFLGIPYNIASYALLLTLIAKEVNLIPHKIVGFFGDLHIYVNHIPQVEEQRKRIAFSLPEIEIVNFTNIFDWQYTDVILKEYQYHPKLKADIAI